MRRVTRARTAAALTAAAVATYLWFVVWNDEHHRQALYDARTNET